MSSEAAVPAVTGRAGRNRRRTWLRVVAVLVDAGLTWLFALALAWGWTDEITSGNVRADDDPAATWWEGFAVGTVPTVAVGLGVCALILLFSGLTRWWPMLFVLAAGATGAAMGATERFPAGLPPGTWVVCAVMLIGSAAGMVESARRYRD